MSPGQPAAANTTNVPPSSTQSSSAVVTQRAAAGISPCDDLTAADVRGLGFDPATKRNADLQAQNVSERGCRWTGRDASVDLLSTDATVAMYRARDDLANVQIRTIAGLPSLTSQIPNDPRGCRVVSDVPRGAIVVQLGVKFEHEAAMGMDSCTAAVRVMEQVAPILLKIK